MKKIILFLTIFLCVLSINSHNEAQATNLKFSDNTKMKHLFYPKNPGTLQGIAAGNRGEIYLSYSTDNKKYGYIYHYTKKGKLIKKSGKLTIGRGQAITYSKGNLYVTAEINGDKNYYTYILDKNLKVVKKWKLVSLIHPTASSMKNNLEMYAISKNASGKYGNEYHINTVSFEEDKDELPEYRNTAALYMDQRIRVPFNNLKNETLQGLSVYNNKFYILTNYKYLEVTASSDGRSNGKVKSTKIVKLNTDRTSAGMSFYKNGRMIMALNGKDEIFITKK